jgi:hypothetical protein
VSTLKLTFQLDHSMKAGQPMLPGGSYLAGPKAQDQASGRRKQDRVQATIWKVPVLLAAILSDLYMIK